MNLRMPFLNFNFVMIHIIHKILVMIKSHLNYLFSNAFFRSIIDSDFFKKLIFIITYNDGKSKV